MHIAVKCHSFTVLRSEAYNRHCAGRHEKAGGAKKHSRETYSSEASPQGAFWCFVRLWFVRGVGRSIFLLPGIKKASRGGEPVFSMAEGDQQTPSALLTKKSSPPGTIFFACRKTLRVFRPFICFPGFPRVPAPRIPPACPCKCSASPQQQVCHAENLVDKVEKVQAWQAIPGGKQQDSCCKCHRITRFLLQMCSDGATL